MGKAFVGHILVGPETIAESQIAPVLEAAKNIRDGVKALIAREEFSREHPDFKEGGRLFAVRWRDFEDYDWIAECSDKEIEEFLYEFVRTWNEQPYTDMVSRLHNGKKILVCGDWSWGDTPEGGGYDSINQADMFGILDLFGIE